MDNNEYDCIDWDIDDSDVCIDDSVFDDEDIRRFVALCERAEQGDTNAQFKLGEYWQCNYDIVKAVKWYRKAAEQGDANAQYKLGFLYGIGCGVNKNEAEAVKWYRKAAEQDHANAQLSIGHYYFYGRGVDKDETEAEKWYLKAIEQGNSLAKRVFEGFNNLRSKS